MGAYRSIYLIVDPERMASPAFDRAVRLARASGATLHLGLYDHLPAIAALGMVNRQAMEQARTAWRATNEHALDAIARRLTAQDVPTSSEVDPATPAAEAIARRMLELEPDLVLKDVRHEPALKRALFTPFDAHLLRLCPAPLLLVASPHDHAPRRVIAAVDTLHPVDGADLDDRIVAEARRLAQPFGAEVHLLHVFEGLPPATAGLIEGVEGLGAAYDELAQADRERFEAFAQRQGFAADRAHRLPGYGATTLADFASDASADLLVVGTNYRTGLDRLLMGSTAERLLERVRCDLLAVHPAGFDADLARHLGLAVPARRAA